MLKNYLKITLRNLFKNRLFVVINVFGLGIALACCIVAYLNWDYNSSWDAYHENTDDIYRVNFLRITNGRPIQNGSCPMPLAAEMENAFSQVDKMMRYSSVNGDFKIGENVFRTSAAAVDQAFFEVFNFPMQYGSTISLKDQSSILISSDLKERYFPDIENPIGKSISYINGEDKIPFQVAGVFETPPQNTSFFADAYFHYEKAADIFEWNLSNWAAFNTTFVRVKNPADVANVEQQLQNYVAIQNKAKPDYKVAEYYLDPFQGMAIRAERDNTWNHWFSSSLPTAAAVSPGIMAILLLLLACFNFTNTSIGISNRRIKEIGIRKVLGSNRKQLVAQFLGENTMVVFMAMGIGLIISAVLVPAYSAMWPFLDIRLNLLENLGLLGFLSVLLLFTAFVAGSYPAFYVSSFQPTTIFRGSVKFSGTNMLSRVLLTLQFAFSLLAIICGFVFSQNAKFQEAYDMGFSMDNIVYAYVGNAQDYAKLRNELMDYDQIQDIAGSAHSISSSWYTDPIKFEETELDVNLMNIGADYLSAIGATIVQGRNFIEKSQNDMQNGVIINQELVNTLGWDNAIDKRIVLQDTIALNVVGVVKDIYYEGGLWDPLEPMMLRYVDDGDFRFLTARADVEDIVAVKSLMDEKWRKVMPDRLSTVSFMNEEKANMSVVNTNIKIIFIFLGIVAALLSAIGLFSLVSLNLLKRMKEIGVRRVLGATTWGLSLRVSKEFIIILLIASVIGCIGGHFLSAMLMSNIWAYHVPFQLLPFVLSVLLLFVVSVIAIGGKVFKATVISPAEVLKDE